MKQFVQIVALQASKGFQIVAVSVAAWETDKQGNKIFCTQPWRSFNHVHIERSMAIICSHNASICVSSLQGSVRNSIRTSATRHGHKPRQGNCDGCWLFPRQKLGACGRWRGVETAEAQPSQDRDEDHDQAQDQKNHEK